jgi:hypothetical protein
MPLIRVSEPIDARIRELQDIRRSVLGRAVTASEVVELLFEGYDIACKLDSIEGA